MRWVCALCGSVKLGPARLRHVDVRRYCMSCSEKTGKLVQRSCPVLDKRRAARTSAKAARAKQAHAAAREQFMHRGVDLVAALWNFWRLPSVREIRERNWGRESGPATLVVRRGVRGAYGRAWIQLRQIDLRVWPNMPVSQVLATLLHEVVHLALPIGMHHKAPFWSLYAVALTEAWPGLEARIHDFRTMHDRMNEVRRAVAAHLE